VNIAKYLFLVTRFMSLIVWCRLFIVRFPY